MPLTDQIQQGESKTLELKESLPKNESIAKTIVAFSNTSGGKLIIGVNDQLSIVGIDDTMLFEIQDKIASIISDSCFPGIIPDIYSVNIEHKLVLVIEVVRGNQKPYYLKNKGQEEGCYIRIGATNRLADPATIAELERQKHHISYDEEVYYDLELNKLDLSPLLDKFKHTGKPLNNEKLENLKLIKTSNDKIYPSNALMVILGKFPHCTIKCARFKGTTMETFIDKKEYSGDIFTALENTQNFVLNHINLQAEIKGLYRDEKYEIPVVALREALVNAIVHRDYVNQGRDIKVGIYDDIVNIVSPGSLPNNITMDDIFNGRSEVRNRVLANVFKELGLIEQWGSGINRIINACKNYGLQSPIIQEKNDYFDIEFIRPQITVSSKESIEQDQSIRQNYERLRTITNDYERLDKEKRTILLYLLEKGKISRKEATILLDLKNTKTYEILTEMVGQNLIKKQGKGRATYYMLS
ncbi:putative DNA binding domain-containing protein [Echinicola sp. CAU 1574]|uniref:DNA binding domain-containing protein n=1 Tax=Echinicola arenosa TaxID=2774144 RepID=A0ABR9AQ20_9BACT|nr:RNA-binding domain-containing protein [Echinicola arenosa]MBD8490025.1 putative DNA binding domain-containing protein [Echinicola arenosa]